MKRKIIFFVMMALAGLVTMQSCKKEDSTLFKTYSSFTTPVVLAPANGNYLAVTGTTVDLKWESVSADGNAQNWDVYFGDSSNPPLVLSGSTSQTYTATVEKGVEYFWHVIGHDANGIPAKSETWSFTVIDPASDISIDMSWATDVKTVVGIDLTPQATVDMRLLVVKASDKSIVAAEDGSAFESYADFNALPDGDYLIAADIYATINAGDFNDPVNIDLTLAFFQPGVIDETITYPKVMTNANACSLYRTYLATVTKAGTAYTIAKAVSYMTPAILTWNGTDGTYPSEVTTTATCAGKTMTGLVFGWMLDWWGEVVIDGGTLEYTTTSSTITIPFQYYCTTTYNGAEQDPYSIQGTGTIDNSGAFPVYTIHYDIKQGSTWIGHYSFLHYGWEQDGFDAVITTDPAGKSASNFVMRPAKPNR
jgi:hypothetical protein